MGITYEQRQKVKAVLQETIDDETESEDNKLLANLMLKTIQFRNGSFYGHLELRMSDETAADYREWKNLVDKLEQSILEELE